MVRAMSDPEAALCSRETLSSSSSKEGDDLRAVRRSGATRLLPEPSRYLPREVCSHDASWQPGGASRTPAPAAVRQRTQPHHRGAQQDPGTVHAEAREVRLGLGEVG